MLNVAPTASLNLPPAIALHDLYGEMNREIHRRPFPFIDRPVRVSHLVFLRGSQGVNRACDNEQLAQLCEAWSLPVPRLDRRFWEDKISVESGGRIRARWENHTEFSSLSLWEEGDFDYPFDNPPSRVLPPEFALSGCPEHGGGLVLGVHVAILNEPSEAGNERKGEGEREAVREHFEGHRLVGSLAVERSATLWTAFQLHSDGFGRILVQNHSMPECRAGRLVQRLLEMESYRTLALLGLPLAREISPRLTDLEYDLRAIFDDLAAIKAEGVQPGQEQHLHWRLTQVSDEVEHLRSRCSYRFAATRAYWAITQERLRELREEQIVGLQTLEEFLDRRLPAAMRTCEATVERIESLSIRAGRAGELLRTRIELTLEHQNQQLLASMERRSRVQLRLQEAVEGLSIVAISYYAVGLTSYLGKAFHVVNHSIKPELLAVAVLPFVVYYLRRKGKAIHRLVDEHEA